MESVGGEKLVNILQWRYATKRFDAARKINAGDWAALEQSMLLAPSSFGLQPWKFIVVNDAELRTKIRKVAWDQSQVTDASHLVVFCARTSVGQDQVERLIGRMCEVRGLPATALSDYKGMMSGFLANPQPGFDSGAWAARQTYLALGMFLTAAASLGIDACPMEGFDSAKVSEILGLSARGLNPVVMATAGYRSAEDKLAGAKKVRFKIEEVIERR